jgi:rhamnose utilization protein RhaD (predicted bifunctional aldolase and dehydrogenase)/NAD(P)-dependent dehydrogenase (short-subunit alcohol dehydrogenase family)
MKSAYSEDEARSFQKRYAPFGEDLALRVYTSRLLGSEPSLVLHGGGNTSVKSVARELTGEAVAVLYVKGSGWDLASIEPQGFPACRLDALLRTLALPELSDPDMVRALRSQMLDPSSPTPSVEALLHAFLPSKFVDHTHASAVLSVVDQPDGAARARDVWGDSLVILPYVMPGFLLARDIQTLGKPAEGAVLVLDKHGIFTFGPTARDSYERMIAAVTTAENYVSRVRAQVPAALPVASSPALVSPHSFLPALRGALARATDGARFVLALCRDERVLRLLAHPDAASITARGSVTPDHVIRTKPFPAWWSPSADASSLTDSLMRTLADYALRYARYFEEHAAAKKEPLTRLDRLPRVVLVPGLGAVTLGRSIDEARVAADIVAEASGVMLDASVIGSYDPVSHADLFDVEYWSLEQAKLKVKSAPGGQLATRIALVTGAARGIGLATATHFLELGAHVVLSDANADALEVACSALISRFGPRVTAFAADVTRPAECSALVAAAVARFGGLDVVVSNAGNAPSGLLHTDSGDAALRSSLELNLLSHQSLAKAAVDVFLAQGMGGVLLFNASKSAFNPGKDFGPYAVPKAALVALMRQYAVDLGGSGIRVNAVNADRIRTALFDGIVESRAKARGVSPDQYFKDNLLGRETTALDVAKAFAYLATAEATTGSVITVDGGNAAAFPR